MTPRWIVAIACVAVLLPGCATSLSVEEAVDRVAEEFVKLALEADEHDDEYLASFFGPAEWLAEAEASPAPLSEIRDAAMELHERLAGLEWPADGIERTRVWALDQMLVALATRADIVQGQGPETFDEESKLLFDVVLPRHDDSHYSGILDEIEAALPGEGPLMLQLAALQQPYFPVPPDRVAAVFEAAVEECRRRTREHIELPEGERVTFEYVTGEQFGGRCVYQGDGHSVLELNTDMPFTVGTLVHLACHEGYPGHHVQSVLADRNLVQGRGWIEYTVAPLYSATSLLAEGAANYGVGLAFSDQELRAFKRDVLLPLAGIDRGQLPEPSAGAARLRVRIEGLMRGLASAGEEISRDYLDGRFDRETTLERLVTYGMLGSTEYAESYLASFEHYRTYVINYGYGEELVRRYIELEAGDDTQRRWAILTRLSSEPFSPSDLL